MEGPTASLLTRLYSRDTSTVSGKWREILYYDGRCESSALIFGDVSRRSKPVPVRVHSNCFAAHVLMSVECDCREQMLLAQSHIVNAGLGVVIVLPQDGRDFGHKARMLALDLAVQRGVTQSEVYQLLAGRTDARNYHTAALILDDLAVQSVDLLTNNNDKVNQLVNLGIDIQAVSPVKIDDMATRPELRLSYEDKLSQGQDV